LLMCQCCDNFMNLGALEAAEERFVEMMLAKDTKGVDLTPKTPVTEQDILMVKFAWELREKVHSDGKQLLQKLNDELRNIENDLIRFTDENLAANTNRIARAAQEIHQIREYMSIWDDYFREKPDFIQL